MYFSVWSVEVASVARKALARHGSCPDADRCVCVARVCVDSKRENTSI